MVINSVLAGPNGRALWGVGLRPLACWDYEFESHRGHGCLSVVSVVCVVRYRSLRRADHSSRGVLPTVVRRCVWSRNLVNEEAMVHWGLLRQKREGKKNPMFRLTFVPFFLFTSLQYSNTYFLLFVWRENFFSCRFGYDTLLSTSGVCPHDGWTNTFSS